MSALPQDVTTGSGKVSTLEPESVGFAEVLFSR